VRASGASTISEKLSNQDFTDPALRRALFLAAPSRLS
jgi:hypothetical protein